MSWHANLGNVKNLNFRLLDCCVYPATGNKIKPVADMRETLYERVGMKSSYFFRLDDLYIVDATRMGYIGRFMNHSCEVCSHP